MGRSLQIALGIFVVSLAGLAIKSAAFWMTGGVTLFFNVLESIIIVLTAVAVIFAVRIASHPPDEQHPFGHHKAEYLSASVVAAMIAGATLAILHWASDGFFAPKAIDAPVMDLAVSNVATLMNIGWGYVVIHQGQRHRSASLAADGKRLLANVCTSVCVVVGVLLVVFTCIVEPDATVSALVALHVLWSGWGVIKESASGLLAEAVPAEDHAEIKDIISTNAVDATAAHAVPKRYAGSATFIDFHLVVPSEMTVGGAHGICDRIEATLWKTIEGLLTTIHVEPEDKAKRAGAIML